MATIDPLKSEPKDVGFDVARTSQIETEVDKVRPVGQPAFTPYDFQGRDETGDEIGLFDSFGAGFRSTGILTGAFRAKGTADPVADPSFAWEDWKSAYPEEASVFDKYLQDPTTAQAEAVLQRMTDTKNATQATELAAKLRDAEATQRDMWANPVSGILGAAGGVLLDVVPLAVGSGGLGAVSGVLRATTAVKTITAGIRAQGAIRAGTVGAGEAFTERVIHTLNDPTITDDDIMLGVVLGTTIGGGLGGMFPRAVGGVFRDLAFDGAEKYSDEVIEAARRTRGFFNENDSVGAARVPGSNTVAVPGKGAGGFGIARAIHKLPGIRNLRTERWVRNPKRVAVDMGIKGREEFENLGLTGHRVFYDQINRLLRIGIANQAEIDGTDVRAITVQDMRTVYMERLTEVETQTQRNYNDLLRAMYGKTKFQGQLLNSAVAELPVIKKLSKTIKAVDLERMADEYSDAFHNDRLSTVDIIPRHIRQKFKQEQLDELMKFVKKQSAIDDAYYQEMGALEVRHGLIDEDELIPGYRPQRWNTNAIRQDAYGFDQFLRRVFQKEPDNAWLKRAFRPVDDNGNPVPFETLEDLRKIDDKLADEALEDWDIAVREDAVEAKAKIDTFRKKELAKFKAESLAEIEARFQKATATARRTQARLEQQFADATDPAEIDRLAVKIEKTEKRIADEELKLETVRTLDKASREAEDFIRRFGNNTRKRGLKKLAKAAKAGDRALRRAEAQTLVSDQITKVRQQLLDNEGFGAVGAPSDFSTSSQRFLRRSIRLGAQRHSEDARRFLNTEAGVARRSYDHSTAPQIALRDVFGTLDATTATDFQDKLRAQFLSGFEEDNARIAGSGKSPAQHSVDQNRAQEFFDTVMRQVTGAEQPGSYVGRAGTGLATIATSLTATALLGGVAIAQLSDLAVTALAGGKMGTGFRFMWGRNGGAARAIKKMDDVQMSVVLQGSNTMDATRFRAQFDLDEDIYIAGGKMNRVRRIVDEIGVVEGWANLMHVWNRMVRGSFGMDFARQMDNHFHQWGSLDADLKRFYAKHGIGDQDAKEIAALLDSEHIMMANGLVRVPNSAKWTELRPDLMLKYKIALRSAGDEALLDPGIADRPFMRSSALGRIFLQFSSFMFTAGEKFIPVLAQEARLNWKQSNVLFSTLAIATLAPLVSGIQAHRYDRLDEWLDKWNDPEGVRDNLWDAMLRSPLMAGASSIHIENALTHLGRHGNDAVEAGVGVRPFKEDQSRFQQMQGLHSLLGAAPSLALKTFPGFVDRVASGEYDKAYDTAAKRIPILNVFYLQMLNNAMKD